MSSNILAEKNPGSLFNIWLEEARAHSSIREPNAMVVATVDLSGQPSTRTVLLKKNLSERFLFFSNYNSRKGRELESNPKISATFYWDPLFKQIHIRGKVTKCSRQESVDYWGTRPKESQLAQLISQQSSPLEKGVELKHLLDQARIEFDQNTVPCPKHWGGYWIEAEQIEFWIGDKFRLHERYIFNKTGFGWSAEQYYP